MNFGIYLAGFLLSAAGVVLGILRKKNTVILITAIASAAFALLCICTLLLIGGID